jgi:hypothetical protein
MQHSRFLVLFMVLCLKLCKFVPKAGAGEQQDEQMGEGNTGKAQFE